MLRGSTPAIISENVRILKARGRDEPTAIREAHAHAKRHAESGALTRAQCDCLADFQMAQRCPARAIDIRAACATGAERFRFSGVRFTSHDDDLSCSEHGLRQPRRAVRDDRVSVTFEIEQVRGLGGVQVVVRFVQQNAMRKSGPASQHVQPRQCCPDVLQLLVVRKTREVNDNAAVRVAKGSQ